MMTQKPVGVATRGLTLGASIENSAWEACMPSTIPDTREIAQILADTAAMK